MLTQQVRHEARHRRDFGDEPGPQFIR